MRCADEHAVGERLACLCPHAITWTVCCAAGMAFIVHDRVGGIDRTGARNQKCDDTCGGLLTYASVGHVVARQTCAFDQHCCICRPSECAEMCTYSNSANPLGLITCRCGLKSLKICDTDCPGQNGSATRAQDKRAQTPSASAKQKPCTYEPITPQRRARRPAMPPPGAVYSSSVSATLSSTPGMPSSPVISTVNGFMASAKPVMP